jgi:hypothetical protein
MINIPTQLRLEKLTKLFDEIAELVHFPSVKMEYVSGTCFNNCIINTEVKSKQLSEIFNSRESSLRLRDFIYDFLGIYCQHLIASAADIEFANKLFSVFSKYFIEMNVNELYVPVAMIKVNKQFQSEFTQYVIVEVPREMWGDEIASTMTPQLPTGKFSFVQNEKTQSPFIDDPYKAYVEYISVMARCIVFGQINEVTTSD